jgi:hypothetical protein
MWSRNTVPTSGVDSALPSSSSSSSAKGDRSSRPETLRANAAANEVVAVAVSNASNASSANERAATRGDRDTLVTPPSPLLLNVERGGEKSQTSISTRAIAAAPKTAPPSREGEVRRDRADADGEISIPPVVELDEPFFSERSTTGERTDARHDDLGLEIHHDARHLHKMSPAVHARRVRFAAYVKVTVGVCGAVVLAAILRVANGATREVEPVNLASAMTRVGVDAPESNRVASTVVVEPAAPPVERDVPPGRAAPNLAEGVALAASVVPLPPSPQSERVLGGENPEKSAIEEKRTARIALEHGQTETAIESGERSVALDATDGEAWLLLGAAYQEKGRHSDARRCFTRCVREGRRGPLGECRAMLR